MSYTNQRYMSSCLDVLNHEILNYTEATGGLDMNLKYNSMRRRKPMLITCGRRPEDIRDVWAVSRDGSDECCHHNVARRDGWVTCECLVAADATHPMVTTCDAAQEQPASR